MLGGVSIRFDLIAIGRVSVDLYGQQIGSPLEDVTTFAKGVGGCPANVAIGAARLGLRAALISRVGDEPMGRFVREQLTREAVDTHALVTDVARLTSLVLLSVRDRHTFPLIFYRENCADSALCADDVDPDFVASARAVLVTGTHFSLPAGAQAQRKAIDAARAHGRRVILDVDYRPNLWGIGGHGAGESRYARSARVTQALAAVLPHCDLIVGTEEELHIAAGLEDTLAAVRRIRTLSAAVIVCKRGPAGCVVFAGAAPESLQDGVVAAGMPVEVYNVLGAGDAFLAGFLRGYLRGEPHEISARYANACGALAVSRLLCSSEFATLAELDHYLAQGSTHRALREDQRLNHLHRATTRRRAPEELLLLGVEHRGGLGQTDAPVNADLGRLARLEQLALEAAARVAAGGDGFGVVLDALTGVETLHAAARHKLWLARAVEQPDAGLLEFQGAASLATHLTEWPAGLTVKCRCVYHPDDPPAVRQGQERNLVRLVAACRAQHRELLLEISAAEHGELRPDTAARVLARLYELDVQPEWWGLEPQPDAHAWELCAAVIAERDALCRGIVLMGGGASTQALSRALGVAATSATVRGFLAGRTIFAPTAQAWLAQQLSDEAAIADLAQRFRMLVEVWSSARASVPGREQRSVS
jgi:5-dehydro-2-deoxygluconokinase